MIEWLIGKQVINKEKENGVITKIDESIHLEITKNKLIEHKEYPIDSLENGILEFVERRDQDKYAVYLFLKQRNITRLVHFTNVKNVSSIKEHGLYSRNQMDRKGISHIYNNDFIQEEYRDYISLSITSPNLPMLYSLTSRYPNEEYEIIFIDASILFKENNDRIYCQTNSANKDLRIKKLHTVEGLKAIFEKDISYRIGSKQGRSSFTRIEIHKDNEPTDLQAEILWCDHIPLKYIMFDESDE